MTIQRFEVLTGEVRRRRWPRDVKEAIVAETLTGDANIAEVARRHGLDRSLLYRWRRAMKVGRCRGESAFVPVRVVGGAARSAIGGHSAPASDGDVPEKAPTGQIEIDLGDGRCVRVDRLVDPAALARVLAVLARP